jgi:hypothetical protein
MKLLKIIWAELQTQHSKTMIQFLMMIYLKTIARVVDKFGSV